MKRRLALVLLLVAGGAIVNVAVAWGYAHLMKKRSSHYPAAFNSAWPIPVAAHWPSTCRIWRVRSLGAFVETGSGIGPAGELYQASRCEFGFPKKCLVRAEGFEIDAALVTRNSFETALRIVWPGFAINTVFYAVGLWGLFAAPFALRRRRRIRRGLCPKCAYPVGTSDVCTECGARVRHP